jgi:PTH1 family peptidyl-tRNA hydrolase
MSSTRILVGLGNPGSRYALTPHNIGFIVVDALAEGEQARWRSPNSAVAVARCEIGGSDVLLVKPLTYMNRSGGGLLALRQMEDFDPAELLVIVDDIALDWGRLRLRRGGSDGGHNGLKSVAESLKTQAFPRLRIGVGPVPAGEDPADYVLAPVPEDGRETMGDVALRAVACVRDAVASGFDRAMSLHNAPSPEGD